MTHRPHAVPVRYGDADYPVLVHLPRGSRGSGGLPLVLELHGSSSNARLQMGMSGFCTLADREGFVVAAPQGIIQMADNGSPDGSWAWNVPGAPTTAGDLPPAGARDDLGFLDAVILELARQLGTDSARVYVAGFSGGARMASAVAGVLPERVAAIAAVGGLRADEIRDRPSPGHTPMPVLAFHGTDDPVNPYHGSRNARWAYGVDEAARMWAEHNGCQPEPVRTTVSTKVLSTAYLAGQGGAEVLLYTVLGDGHTWAGSQAHSVPPGYGAPNSRGQRHRVRVGVLRPAPPAGTGAGS